MKKYSSILIITFLMILLPITRAFALLNIELTKWANNAIPIAIVPFAGQDKDSSLPNNIAAVVSTDLRNSGRFKVLDSGKIAQFPANPQMVDLHYWRLQAVDNVVVGNVQALGGDQYKITVSLMNVFGGHQASPQGNNQILFSQNFSAQGGELRGIAHHISDLVYQQLLGVRGVFSTHIAYVVVDRAAGVPKYLLEVADADGFNPKPLLTSSQPIMSPSWSPDARRVAYVSFENQKPQIFVQDIRTGQRTIATNYPGINGAPAWAPDGRQLAVVLSKTGHPKIYLVDLDTHVTRQVTQGSWIDTEPSWSPDGRSLIFTSDRGGSPQIYELAVGSGAIKRLTYDGNYNARAAYTPDGHSIVMMHRDDVGDFDIAIQDLQNGIMTLLSKARLDDSPSIAPNGRMVLFANSEGRSVSLGIVSTDGNVSLRLPAPEGDVQSPAWSPFMA